MRVFLDNLPFVEEFEGVRIYLSGTSFVADIGGRQVRKPSVAAMRKEIKQRSEPILAIETNWTERHTVIRISGYKKHKSGSVYASYETVEFQDESGRKISQGRTLLVHTPELQRKLDRIQSIRKRLDEKFRDLTAKAERLTVESFERERAKLNPPAPEPSKPLRLAIPDRKRR